MVISIEFIIPFKFSPNVKYSEESSLISRFKAEFGEISSQSSPWSRLETLTTLESSSFFRETATVNHFSKSVKSVTCFYYGVDTQN